jgi:putative FmdB family regulatory protein
LPLYEYRCLKCDRHTDKIENLNGPHLKKCPHCGGKVESVITAPSIQFKGSGWYVNDYGRGKSSGGDSGKLEKAEGSEKSEKADSKPASSSKDQKKTSGSSKEK